MACIRSLCETLSWQAPGQALRLAAVVAALAAAAWQGTLPQVAWAQPDAAADDDPFADELNPFGGKPKKPAAEGGKQPAETVPKPPSPRIPAEGR